MTHDNRIWETVTKGDSCSDVKYWRSK